MNANLTPEENLSKILTREIGFVPDSVTYLDQFFHAWADTRERPGEPRTDLIFLHFVQVSEEVISQLSLDEKEYDVEAGLMRFDGSQPVRLVVKEMYQRFLGSI